ncbi:Gfo/Idh/MocA family oxidoreductase [Streptomyces sp. NPDC050997]|uniref:Gfo/Idh/MocA family protein n=1 Tax=Streptomyces sp. NPDC050997 TaxID=3155519 RepID=UPI00343E899C
MNNGNDSDGSEDAPTLGVGLISVGWMGRLHTRAYQAIPVVYPELGLRPRLVHAADTAPDRALYAREVLGYARSSADYREVLADPEVDVVSICGPNHVHREIAVAAAQVGKPFWIEKPVGRNVTETAAVAAAARAAGVETSVGYNYRGAPAVERIRELVADGTLGRITNVRSVFYCGYAAEPKGALSWRFRREFAGSGALGDLLSHVVDLVQYVVGPIAEASSLLSTVYSERPILPMGSGTHFAVIEDGVMAPVENDDHVAALVRFADGPHITGAVGTLEASRVIVGPQCGLAIEVYGTDGSASWNFERLNELRLCLGRGGPDVGYTTVLANASMGDYARFQPGPANSMGFDDLKVIEAKKFLTALAGGEQRNATIHDAHQDAEVLAAVAASAEDGLWHPVSTVPDAAYGRRPHVEAAHA